MSYDLRYARPEDAPSVKALWDICFPGEAPFSDYFFAELYDPAYALLCVREDGSPAGMLHMLPCAMRWLGREVPTAYIYGLAVHPDDRRRGVASDLLDQALFEMHLRGILLAVLIPQEDWLFSFYRPFGFAPVFRHPKRTYRFAQTPRPAGEGDIPLLGALYEAHLGARAHLTRPPAHWRQILRECALSGGRVLLDGHDGYAVYPDGGDEPSECFGPGAAEAGPPVPFGCLRIVKAVRALELAAQAGRSTPKGPAEDDYAPWNLAPEDGTAAPPDAPVWDAAALAEALFAPDNPYMHLMHN
ncbi:MAG: GNAT family N-acetyltransferase [Oscillospiraceae bacterium]|jgi:ribosomal protein S18 acetylase RimI-like enzyme|nr:GNAT family N-acetyltransferase [Oscillospiraceae bacterium]